MRTLFDLLHIAKKDLLEFVRDRTRLVTFVIMPIFMLIMVGFIFPSQTSIKNINIGVANQAGTAGSQLVKIVSNLEVTAGSKAFNVHNYNSEDAIKTAIRNQSINGGIFIPANFGTTIKSGKQANVVIVQDQSNPQISAITTAALQNVVEGYGKGVSAEKIGIMLAKTPGGPNKNVISAIISPVTSSLTGLFPGNTNYFEFVAPGIMTMVVLTAVLTGLAASVSREKETGTLDGILIAPISRLAIILGKATAQATRGLAQGIMVLVLSIIFFHVTINGSVILVLLILLLGIFSFVGMGILVSASATEQETATQLLFMFQFPMLFLSGVFFPIQQMPVVMQYISKIIPLTYAIEAMRKVMILGGNMASVSNDLIILVIFGAVTLIIAVPVFKMMITQ
jgi:ABC-2 type transport system permease protein